MTYNTHEDTSHCLLTLTSSERSSKNVSYRVGWQEKAQHRIGSAANESEKNKSFINMMISLDSLITSLTS
jgi:hypothetical protein